MPTQVGNTKKTLLQSGKCQAQGHPILSETDVKIWLYKGKTRMACLKCIDLRKRPTLGRARSNVTNPREVILDCSHINLYVAPVPISEETVYCPTCRDWSEVVGWGNTIIKDEPKKGN